MIRIIYWDLGGVCVTDNLEEAYVHCRIQYTDQQKMAWKKYRCGKISQDVFLTEALQNTSLQKDKEHFRRISKGLIQEKPRGAIPLIKKIHVKGYYKQGII